MYKLGFLFMFWVIPHQLFAIPPSIASIVRTFEGKNKAAKESIKSAEDGKNSLDKPCIQATDLSVKGDENASQSLPLLSNAQQARLAIDQAIKDGKLVSHPATWYYRGVIYDRLLRDHVASEEASTLLDEVLTAYRQAKKLGMQKNKQFYSFALENLAALWRYFLNRGMGYYRQEAVDQAIEQFLICRRILPDEPTPLLYMAIVYHSADQSEEALRCYQDYVVVKGPQFEVARAMAAIHYYKLNNFDKAIAMLNEALLQFPFNNELLEEKCLIYEVAGSTDAYVASLAAALQRKEIDACYAYAYLLDRQGGMQEAIAYYEQVLKAHPHQYDTIRQIGFLFYNEAIKLYTHTLKLVGDRAHLESPPVDDGLGLMHATVWRWWPHARAWAGGHPILGLFPIERLFSPRWIVYPHPLVRPTKVSNLGYLLQSGSLPVTAPLYGYIHTKNAIALARNRWVQTIVALEKYLKQALYYLKIARAQNQKDKAVAQALYYSYYHLKKYGSAYRLFRKMQRQKQYLDDDPFMGHKDQMQ